MILLFLLLVHTTHIMAASVVNTNGIANNLEDNVDGFRMFSREKSVPLLETSECIAQFNPATSKEDFPLHYAVFQGDMKAVEKLINETNINSLDTHGK